MLRYIRVGYLERDCWFKKKKSFLIDCFYGFVPFSGQHPHFGSQIPTITSLTMQQLALRYAKCMVLPLHHLVTVRFSYRHLYKWCFFCTPSVSEDLYF